MRINKTCQPQVESACGNRVLTVQNLRKAYKRPGEPEMLALNDVSFYVPAGTCVGLVGKSGSGKSTTASLIMRLQDATSGRILIDSTNVVNLRGKALRWMYKQVQVVFQNPAGSFDPRRTLGYGIAEALITCCGMTKAAARTRSKELLVQCGLPDDFVDRFAHQVSGGQCQRAAIARALAMHPRLLICDEATSALDVTVQKQIMLLLSDIRRTTNMAMLFICHDIALTQEICDYLLVMDSGQIVEQGFTEHVINNPQHPCTKQLIDAALP